MDRGASFDGRCGGKSNRIRELSHLAHSIGGKNVQRKLTSGFIGFSLLLGALLFAPSGCAADMSGSEILSQVDQSMRSESRIMHQTMTLYSSSGQARTRELRMENQRSDEEDKMLVRFLAPADVRRTGLLMVDDDMWLYLPALGRVRRIAGHAKQGSFMGSDFTYTDMEQIGSTGFAPDYAPVLLGTEVLNDTDVYVLELEPVSEDSDYRQLTMYVDRELFLPRQIEYLDTDGELIKVLKTYDIAEMDGRPTASRTEMQNVQTGTKTVLTVTEVEFDVSIDDAVFTTRNLERGQ